MAELNLKQIIDRLNAEFTGESRKLVFWYDDKAEFAEDMETAELTNAKIYRLRPDNQFYTKYFLERVDRSTNYLIYAPFPKPDVRENHLEDTLLYSKRFFADRASLLLLDLGIAEKYKPLIEQHIKFFANKERSQRFYDLEIENFNEENILIGLLSAVCRAHTSSFEEVLRIVLTEKGNFPEEEGETVPGHGGLEDNIFLREFEKYELLTAFWRLCEQHFGYTDGKPSLERLLATMFVTYTGRYLQAELPAAWKSFVSYKSGNIIAFLDSLMNSVLYRDRYDALSAHVAKELNVSRAFAGMRVDSLADCDTFLAADQVLVKWLITNDYGFITDYLAEFIRELRKEQYGDALDKYFRLGRNLNQRDTIAVRKIVGAYVKLLYPDGVFTKEQMEEILVFALEMRRRVKEQLKKLGGMEFYDVNFSYIDLDTFEERFVSVPEQGGGMLIPDGICNPGQVYTVGQGKFGMIGVFRLESQMLPGNGKFERTGLGSDRDCKESTNTAFNFLKANGNRISGSISTAMRDDIINYQDLQGIGMTGKLALPTLIALCSIALGRPALSSLAVLGEISISGTILKVDELANSLQLCLDSGAKKVLLPISSAADLGSVPPELVGSFNLIFYSSAEDAVFKALGVE